MSDYADPQSMERLTGRAYFTPAGGSSVVDLGNIQLLKLDYGPKRKQHIKNRHGKAIVDRDDAYGVDPKFTIEVDEFVTPLLPLIFGGTALADSVQSSATGVTVTFNAALGQTFDLGFFDVRNVAMTLPVGKSAGSDYIVDAGLGKIYIPLSSTIAPGASVTVTFDRNGVTFDNISSFDQLNRLGAMQVFEEDEYSLIPKAFYSFQCSLSSDGTGETKGDDFKKCTLIATITGAMTVLKRTDFDDLLFDDGTVMELG